MPFIPVRPPRARSLDLAAQRIYAILEREERAKKHAREQFAQRQPVQSQSAPYKRVPLQARNRSLPSPDPKHSEVTPDDWYAFHHASRRSGMATETELEAARSTFGHEGGMTVDPNAGGANDPGIAGMTQSYMTDARDRRIARDLETDPYKLSVDEVGRWYDIYIDDALDKVGGGAALTQVRDRKLAMQPFDTLFQHGRYGGARVIQDAVNKTISRIPDDKRREHDLTPIVVEDTAVPRVVGPKTLERIKRLSASGYATDLRRAIADRSDLKQPTKARHDTYR